MKKKKLLIPLAVLSLSLGSAVGLAACKNKDNDKTPCEKHIDRNGDGICDECGSEILAVAFNLPATIANGKVIADKSAYTVGDNCILTVVPDTGYQIKSIKINGEEKVSSIVSRKLSFEVTGDITVTAEFERINVTLNINDLPEDCKVEFVKEGGYKFGENVAIKITEGENYTLVGFTVNGEDKLADIVDGVYTVGEYAKNNGVITVSANFIKSVDASVLTVTAKDKAGAAVSLAGEKISLANVNGSYELTFDEQGKLSGEIYSGEYAAKLSLDGYAEKTVTVGTTASAEEFVYTFATGVDRLPVGGMDNANNGVITLGGKNSEAAMPSKAILNIGTTNAKKDTVFVDFTVTMKEDVEDAASWRRFGVILDEDNNGFGIRLGLMGRPYNFLYATDSEFTGYSHKTFEEALESKTVTVPETALPLGIRSELGANVDETTHAGNPVRFRAVKAGNAFALYFLKGEEWVFINSYVSDEAESANLKIMFLGSYCTWEFANISFDAREGFTFVPYTAPTDTEYGWQPHLKDKDGKCYNVLGVEISEESVRIDKVKMLENAKIMFKGVTGLTKTDIKVKDAFGKDKEFTFDEVTGIVTIPAISVGKAELEYTLNGNTFFATAELTETVKEISLTLTALSPADVTTAESLGDGNDMDKSRAKNELAALNTVDSVKNAKYYTFEVTAAIKTEIDGTNSWRICGFGLSESLTIWQRYMKRTDAKESGMWFNDGANIGDPGVGSDNHVSSKYILHDDFGTLPEFMNHQDHVLNGNSVRYRIVRSNTLIEVFAYNPTNGEEGWVKLFNLTCEEDMLNEFTVNSCYESWTFSDIIFSTSVARDGLTQESATVNVASGIQNGTVSATEGLFVGDDCVINITPAKGYQLKTLTVDGEPVALAQIIDGKYTFRLTKSVTEVTAEFEEQVYTANVTLTGATTELKDKVITFVNGEDVQQATIVKDGETYKITINRAIFGTFDAYFADDGYFIGNIVIGGADQTEEIALTADWATSTGVKNGEATTTYGVAKVEIDGENNKIVLGGLGTAIFVDGNSGGSTARANINLGYDTLKNNSAIISFTLKLKDVNWAGSWRKAGLIVNDKNEGVAFYWRDDNKNDAGQGIIHNLVNKSLNAGSAEGIGDIAENIDDAFRTEVLGTGLDVLVIKASDKLQVLLSSGEEYVLVYTADVDKNALSKMEFLGSYCDWEFTNISYTAKDELTYHAKVEATSSTEGKKAHFTDKDGKFYSEIGAEVQESELVIEKLPIAENVKVTLNLGDSVTLVKEDLTVTDKTGEEVAFTFADNVITIASIVKGKFTVTEKTGMCFDFVVENNDETFTVGKSDAYYIVADFIVATAGDGNAIASDSIARLAGEKNFSIETTIKMPERKTDGGGWARAGVQIADGVIIGFEWNDWNDKFGAGDNTFVIAKHSDLTGDGDKLADMPDWFHNMQTLEQNGFKVRIERVEDRIFVYAFNTAIQEWVKLAETVIGSDAETNVKLIARQYYSWSFTDTKVTVIDANKATN